MKKITATFKIPKNKIKNSNTPLNHIVAAQKTAWIREYSEKIWSDAALTQFNIKAIEPDKNSIKQVELSQKAKETIERLESFNKDLEENLKEEKILKELHEVNKINKAELRKAKRNDNMEKVLELETKITNYENNVNANKAARKRIKSTISSIKRMQMPEIQKEIRKNEKTIKDSYLAEKLKINSEQQLFQKCAVIVKVQNITNREFDSPNFWPTVKAILDGATDSSIIWSDDNNSVVEGGTLFLAGGSKEKENYVFDIEIIDEWPW